MNKHVEEEEEEKKDVLLLLLFHVSFSRERKIRLKMDKTKEKANDLDLED